MNVRVGPEGRILIPAAVRKATGIEPGSTLVLLVEGDHIELIPREAIERRLHAMFADVQVSMADELIAERHAEVDRELAEH